MSTVLESKTIMGLERKVVEARGFDCIKIAGAFLRYLYNERPDEPGHYVITKENCGENDGGPPRITECLITTISMSEGLRKPIARIHDLGRWSYLIEQISEFPIDKPLSGFDPKEYLRK